MLVWRGERNFFDTVPVFWSLEASDETLSWDDWQALWQTNGNVGSKNLPIDWMIERPFDSAEFIGRLTPSIWQLGPGLTELNPAIQGSTDGSDAGADLAELPLTTESKPAPSKVPAKTKSAPTSATNSVRPSPDSQTPKATSTVSGAASASPE